MKEARKLNFKETATDILFDIIGGILYAAGIYSFAANAEFAPGGISGLGIIINHFTNIPIGTCVLLLNVPVILICLKMLGKRFLLKSLCTMAISTVFLDVVFPQLPSYSGDPLMAALFAGALSGAGLGLVYARGSSTGGTDFVIMSLRKKMPHLSIGTISILVDGCVILLGGLVFGRIDAVLQGIVMTALSTMMVDKITTGFVTGQVVFIVTAHGSDVSKKIMDETERGVTAIKGIGMFTGAEKNILMCACSRAEAVRIRSLVHKEDRSALVMICPFDSVYGEGFQDHAS